MTITKIVYAASNDSMGGTSLEHCDLYREWAKAQIEKEYTDADVTVSPSDTEYNCSIAISDEQEYPNEQEMADARAFMAELWGRCPWDFI